METKKVIPINMLPISGEVELQLNTSISNYKRMGIEIELVDLVVGGVSTIKITQSDIKNGYILNQKELVERCHDVLSITNLKFKIIPVVFSLDVELVTIDWINSKMDEFGIKRKDLVKQLALDKSYISLLFSDKSNSRKIGLSRPMKATFFYYFLTYQLNRDFRENN